MSQPQNLYAWAAGYNVALNSLIVITSVTASGDNKPFPPPVCRGNYNPGQLKTRTDSLDFYGGFNVTSFDWAALTWNQYAYIYTTILSGNYSGPVTLLLRVGFDAYVRQNAVLHLPPQALTDGKFFAPKKVSCRVTRLTDPV
jgi:hypothetical protein